MFNQKKRDREDNQINNESPISRCIGDLRDGKFETLQKICHMLSVDELEPVILEIAKKNDIQCLHFIFPYICCHDFDAVLQKLRDFLTNCVTTSDFIESDFIIKMTELSFSHLLKTYEFEYLCDWFIFPIFASTIHIAAESKTKFWIYIIEEYFSSMTHYRAQFLTVPLKFCESEVVIKKSIEMYGLTDINYCIPGDGFESTALMISVRNKNIVAVKFLVEKMNATISILTRGNHSAVSQCIVFHAHEIFEYFFEKFGKLVFDFLFTVFDSFFGPLNSIQYINRPEMSSSSRQKFLDIISIFVRKFYSDLSENEIYYSLLLRCRN